MNDSISYRFPCRCGLEPKWRVQDEVQVPEVQERAAEEVAVAEEQRVESEEDDDDEEDESQRPPKALETAPLTLRPTQRPLEF